MLVMSELPRKPEISPEAKFLMLLGKVRQRFFDAQRQTDAVDVQQQRIPFRRFVPDAEREVVVGRFMVTNSTDEAEQVGVETIALGVPFTPSPGSTDLTFQEPYFLWYQQTSEGEKAVQVDVASIRELFAGESAAETLDSFYEKVESYELVPLSHDRA